MQDLVVLTSKEEVVDFTNSLWKTPEFQESAQTPGTLIHDMVEKFAQVPRIFSRYTDPDVEKFHFVNQFGVVPLREGWYEDGEGEKWNNADAMQDLFYLHEIRHVNERDYVRDVSFPKWVSRWYENETDASLLSEVLVYFHFPTLRDQTFIEEIWADRFLENRHRIGSLITSAETKMGFETPEDNHDFFQEDPEVFMIFLRRLREAILHHTESCSDKIERGISQWLGRNFVYYRHWREEFQEIENRMCDFLEAAKIDREAAVQEHVTWLEQKQGDGICPYENVARGFNDTIKKAGRRQK